ncbi:MAG: hypothetical protein JNM56_17505, partial [Planctomycetia bacterium]|nr:hypothetical protein [Planctomycetia bacterium]
KTRLLTTVGSVLGTADFLAPEQALDFHRADTRSDIYGLGCTFYCLLAGQPPFAGKSFAQKLMCHQQAPPPPLEQFRQDVPSKVREILQKMLAKRPDDRYQTPAEVAGELAECLGLHQLPATAVATGRFAAAARAPLSTATDRTMILTGPQRPAPRRRRLLWLPVAGGAGLLALGLLLLLTGGSQRRESAGAVKPTYAFTHRALAATSAKTGLPTTARAVLPVLPDAERLVVLAQSSDGWRYIAAPEVAALGIAQCKAPDFDDAKWAIGKAPLGYGEKEIEKRGGTTVGQRNVPFLFRRSFDLPADLLQRGEAGFRVCIASDDSAIVYLNGELLDDDPSRGHDFRYWNRTVETPAKLFRPGRNVLAAYVKNYNGSSDLYWDIEITLAGALPPGK